VHYSEQLALALPELTDDPKQLTRAAKVALAFPDGVRDNVLSFAHHDRVANLPADDAKALLEQSKQEGWNARRLRLEADKRSAELAQKTIFDDDDWEYRELQDIARRYYAARFSVRIDAIQLMLSSAEVAPALKANYQAWVEAGKDYFDEMTPRAFDP
jgi:hypothetical protein